MTNIKESTTADTSDQRTIEADRAGESAGSPTELADRFLAAVASGRGHDLRALYSVDAELDATVPNWRFTRRGADAVAAEYAQWFSAPGHIEELDVAPTHDGVVITYLLSWEEGEVPHAAHHCHSLRIVEGRITRDRVFCGGRWNAALLAEMEAAGDAI